MRNLKFNSVKAENILCFGSSGIELVFEDYGAVSLLRGINLDATGTSSNPASNGAGKSSIPELLSIGLYGRTIKKPKKNKGDQIINVLADKGEVEVQWDDYRVWRQFRRSKSGGISSKLKLWKSPHKIWDKSTEIEKSVDEIQSEIDRVVGLSHHAFCNVVIFDDSNTYSFLEADLPTKRQIVENLLDLDQYKEYHKNCKGFIKELNRNIDNLKREYIRFHEEAESCDKRIELLQKQEKHWSIENKNEVISIEARIKIKQTELEKSDSGLLLKKWSLSQERLKEISSETVDLEQKKDKLLQLISLAQEKLETVQEDKNKITEVVQGHNYNLKTAQLELQKANVLISQLQDLEEGTVCPVCHATVNRSNYGHVLSHGQEVSDKCTSKIQDSFVLLEKEKDKLTQKSNSILALKDKIDEAKGKISSIEVKTKTLYKESLQLSSLPKPEGNIVEKLLEAEIVELKSQLKAKKEAESPYKEIVVQAENEKEELEKKHGQKGKELEEAEAELPYYEYWLEAFGDNGIRKFVIDNINPALNERISHWMHCLADGLIEVEFDNQFEETIKRKGNSASYHNMSFGECRRINLAISQSFSYVIMLDSGNCPSIVFLDEITGGGIDKPGVFGVYNMILELAKERQVFVTTHNETLISLLQGCDEITLKKQNDISTLMP